MNEQQLTELFRDEWSTIEVGPAPVEAVVTDSGRHRRRVVTSVTLGLAAVLALAVVLAVSIGGEPDLDPVDTVVRTEQNPLDVAWVVGDELHLGSVVVEVPAGEVVSLTQVPGGDSYGVVYSLVDGPVVHVAADGSTTTLDDPGTPVQVVGSGTAWVAWVDARGQSPELVVWDTGTGEQVGRQPLSYDEAPEASFSERGRVLAIAGESVYVQLPVGGQVVWTPGPDGTSALELPGGHQLLDIADGVTLTLSPRGDGLRLTSGGQPDVAVPGGRDAELSSDGRYLKPGTPSGVSTAAALAVLATGTGRRVPLDLAQDLGYNDVALDAALGTGTVTFVVGRDFLVPDDLTEGDAGYRTVRLVRCTLATGECAVAVDDLGSEPTPRSPVLFAR